MQSSTVGSRQQWNAITYQIWCLWFVKPIVALRRGCARQTISELAAIARLQVRATRRPLEAEEAAAAGCGGTAVAAESGGYAATLVLVLAIR